jgi:regulator of RNase E activity RraA
VRLELPIRMAPVGIRPLAAGTCVAGRAVPVRHYGSVDVFLEACGPARAGNILVIDNGGRKDEGCIGDLTALECRAAGLAAMVIWGVHRDTAELVEIGFPIFSYGTCSAGPLRAEPREPEALVSARFGPHTVIGEDMVFADDDGVLFLAADRAVEVLQRAEAIQRTERRQAGLLAGGKNLREQLQFGDYLRRRAEDPGYTFRAHLRRIGGAIEE